MYKYDIPVLHMEGVGRIMKHRINQSKLEEILKAWTGPVEETAETKRLNPIWGTSVGVPEKGNEN